MGLALGTQGDAQGRGPIDAFRRLCRTTTRIAKTVFAKLRPHGKLPKDSNVGNFLASAFFR